MSQELWKYLPHIPQQNKKPSVLKRRSEVTDKQVLNLTGGLFPLKIVDTANQGMHNNNQNTIHYVFAPIIQRNTKIGPIYHWVTQQQQKKLYHGQKFNVDPDIVEFTQQEYMQLEEHQWRYQIVKQIFQLMGRFNLNFVVVHDRISDPNLTVQDIKQIYFGVSRQILQKREMKQKLLYSYTFDKKHETNRKFQLQKYMMRNKGDTDRQKTLIAEIKRLDILIKKEEREQINLKRVLKLDQIPDQVFNLGNINENDLKKNKKVYTRQQYLMSPLRLPGKVFERLNDVLNGMNIPEKIIATEQNADLYDKLRQKVLLMFSIQRYIKKKESQRRLVDQKKKRLVMQQQDQSKKLYPMKNVDAGPKKKIHTGPIQPPVNQIVNTSTPQAPK